MKAEYNSMEKHKGANKWKLGPITLVSFFLKFFNENQLMTLFFPPLLCSLSSLMLKNVLSVHHPPSAVQLFFVLEDFVW